MKKLCAPRHYQSSDVKFFVEFSSKNATTKRRIRTPKTILRILTPTTCSFRVSLSYSFSRNFCYVPCTLPRQRARRYRILATRHSILSRSSKHGGRRRMSPRVSWILEFGGLRSFVYLLLFMFINFCFEMTMRTIAGKWTWSIRLCSVSWATIYNSMAGWGESRYLRRVAKA